MKSKYFIPLLAALIFSGCLSSFFAKKTQDDPDSSDRMVVVVPQERIPGIYASGIVVGGFDDPIEPAALDSVWREYRKKSAVKEETGKGNAIIKKYGVDFPQRETPPSASVDELGLFSPAFLAKVLASSGSARGVEMEVRPAIFYPDGDGYRDSVEITLRFDKKADWEMVVADRNLRVIYHAVPGRAESWKHIWKGMAVNGLIPREGLYYVVAAGKDGNGSDVYTAHARVLLAKVLPPSRPRVEILSPQEGEFTTSGDMEFLYRVDGDTFRGDTAFTEEGYHQIIVTARRGPFSTSDSVVVLFDSAAPLVSTDWPHDTVLYEPEVSVAWSLFDKGLGLDTLVTETYWLMPGLHVYSKSVTDSAGFTGRDSVWIEYAQEYTPVGGTITITVRVISEEWR
jgi:hypothetical protein